MLLVIKGVLSGRVEPNTQNPTPKGAPFYIASERFEAKPDIQSLFKVSERIASALISRVRPGRSSIRKQKIKKALIAATASVHGLEPWTRNRLHYPMKGLAFF